MFSRDAKRMSQARTNSLLTPRTQPRIFAMLTTGDLVRRTKPFFPLIAGGGTFDPSNPTNTQVFGPLIAPWEAVDIWIVFFCSLRRRRDFIGESRLMHRLERQSVSRKCSSAT